MFMHLSPKERLGYVALAAILLTGGGFVLAQKLRRPAAINLHDTPQPPVSFDHGASRSTEKSPSRTEQSTSRQIIVDVAGAVNNPGLVSLPPGSRVWDAINQAGGPTDDAVIDSVNLAAKATDGSQVYVPHRSIPGIPAPVAPSGSGFHRSGRTKQPAGPVDINTADVMQLSTLPGLGVGLAQRIVDYRNEHGTFRSVDDLQVVQGLGKKRIEELRQWLTAD